MSWNTTAVSSFADFVKGLDSVLPTTAFGHGTYWFRGQINAKWDLEPSFLRNTAGLKLTSEQARDLEENALKAFQAKAHLFVSPQLLEKVKTIPCWWAVMQHHGAPTRLLDWTRSPYVAAYFAAQNDASAEAGAVWCFCSKMLQESFERQCCAAPDFAAKEAPEWFSNKLVELSGTQLLLPLSFSLVSSERMAAQQSTFTMCFNVQAKHSCILQQIDCPYLRKFVIPHEAKPEFLLRLRDMNITGASLFPGVDGLGQSIRDLLSMGGHSRRAP